MLDREAGVGARDDDQVEHPHVATQEDDEGRRNHAARRAMLLRQLSVISAEILRESRDLAKAGTPILVAFLLEREDVLDAEPAMLAGLALPSPPRRSPSNVARPTPAGQSQTGVAP